MAMRSLPRQEKSGERSSEANRVGAMSWKPSGSGWRRPPKATKAVRKRSFGADEAVLDAEPAAQRQRPGLVGDEGVGPAFHEEAVAPLGLDDAAQPVTRLEQRQLEPLSALARALHRPMGRGEPGDAAADDDESHGGGRSARRHLVDHVHEGPHVVHRRLLMHAVAEVEDMARTARGAVEDGAERRGGSPAPAPGERRDRDCPAPPPRPPVDPRSRPAPHASRGRSRPRPPPSSAPAGSRCRCRSGWRARRARAGSAPRGYAAARTRGSPRATACPPRSRRAGRPGRRRRSAR